MSRVVVSLRVRVSRLYRETPPNEARLRVTSSSQPPNTTSLRSEALLARRLREVMDMNRTTSNLFFGATLFAFALTGCFGGETPAAPTADTLEPSGAADEANNTKTPPTAPATSSAPSAPAPPSSVPNQDAGAPTRTLALQCQGPQAPTRNAICLETAEGRAGDVVDLEVHLLRTAACGTAEYAMGVIQIDPSKFEIVNSDNQPDCLLREQSASLSSPNLDVISWQVFDRSVAPATCTASAGIGKVDIIKVRIKAGTPAGDYDLPFETSELLGGGAGCSGVFLDIAGKIRVLP